MKLVVEIGEYTKDGRLKCYAKPLLVTDEHDCDMIYDKESQKETISRLMDLSDKITQATKDYYISISSAPIADKNSSTEASTV